LGQFKDGVAVLHLPTDYPRPAVQSFEGDRIFFEIDRQETALLDELAKSRDVTLYMLLLTILNVWLTKLCGQEEIIVGSAVAGRRHADLEGLIGMFVNSIALKNHPVGEKSFGRFLEDVKENTLAAFDNQDYQFEDLVDKLELSRDTSRNPLFDVMFVLQNMEKVEVEMPGMGSKSTGYENRMTKFDLTLAGIEAGDSLFFTLEYCTKLFKETTVERFIRYFKKIVSSVPEAPDQQLAEIEILSKEERRELLFDFNDTRTAYPKEKTIDELFEEQVKAHPHQVAAAYEMAFMTYEELNGRSTGLARFLRSRGVKGGAVGIMVEYSLEMAVGILGILKTGGAYLPINSDYPEERKRYLLADGGVEILLTNCRDQCPYGVDMIHLGDAGIYKGGGNERLEKMHHCDSLAYIMYTSGSTGLPKGTLIGHCSVVRLVKNTNFVEFREAGRILQTGALEFDASTFEIWGSLLNGLTLYLVSKDKLLIPEKLKDAVIRNDIGTMWLTSPLFNQVLDTDIEVFNGLRCLLVGGDVLSPSHINRLKRGFPAIRVINGYGPTENTTFSTTHLIEREYRDSIPIGRPIANSTAYILDRYCRLVPVGVVGELCVGGDGISRGYLNNPEQTKDKFIMNPNASGERLYRTGDLARFLEDGSIEFLGRMDQQVKIRGYRVEPAEIENHLMRIDLIREAVVVNREGGSGERTLCAYIVWSGEHEVDTSAVRGILSKRLPDYMIPSYFVTLDSMPLTVNKKIDFRALPVPGIGAAGSGYTPPRDEVEKTLIKIWSELLGVESNVIGTDANFFELGGHSLKAANLVTRIHKELDVKVPLIEIFRTPTVREISKYLKGALADRYISIKPVEKREYYVLSSAQKRLFILQNEEKLTAVYNLPYIVELEGKVEKGRLGHVFKELIGRHESLRTSFMLVEGKGVQRIHDTGDVDFAVDYFEVPEPVVGGDSNRVEEIIGNFVRPFDLSKPPLLRAGLIRAAQDRYVFMADMHHIIADGTSMGLLMNEYSALYGGAKLPGLRLQYKDFSEWHNALFKSGEIKRQEAYWLAAFEGDLPLLNLPTDYVRPARQTFAGQSVSFSLARGESVALRDLALEEEATLFMVLLAIYNILFSRLSGQEDIIIGTAAAGRRHADLETIIGMFINTLALRNYPVGDRSFRLFLREIRERTLEAFENQDYQFEDLVDRLSLKRDVSRNPLFDVFFVFQNFDVRAKSLPQGEAADWKLRAIGYENRAARFDLSIFGGEAGEELAFLFEFNVKLFKRETIEKIAEDFKSIVRAVTGNRDIKIKDIELEDDAVTYNEAYMDMDVKFNLNF
jgi:amino acid adenylation domain-containing protein